MKTIEERAKQAQALYKDESRRTFNSTHHNFTDWEYGYCQGATEQKEIDIQKFISLIDSLNIDKLYMESHALSDGSRIPNQEFIEHIRKVINN